MATQDSILASIPLDMFCYILLADLTGCRIALSQRLSSAVFFIAAMTTMITETPTMPQWAAAESGAPPGTPRISLTQLPAWTPSNHAAEMAKVTIPKIGPSPMKGLIDSGVLLGYATR